MESCQGKLSPLSNLKTKKSSIFTIGCVVKNIQNFSGKMFIFVNDGSEINNIQIIIFKNINDINTDNITIGSTIICDIQKKIFIDKNNQSKIDYKLTKIWKIFPSSIDYPIQPKYHTTDFLRTIPHLRQNTRLFMAIFKIRNEVLFQLRNFLYQNNFIEINTPIFTQNDCEGGGENFIVNDNQNLPFFNTNCYLTVSGQLHLEPFCQTFKNVFTFSPAFRAEKANTSRHLAEFYMLEIEMKFVSLEIMQKFILSLVRFVFQKLLVNCETCFNFLEQFHKISLKENLQKIIHQEGQILSYSDAINILKSANANFKYPLVGTYPAIQTEHEKYLCEVYFKNKMVVIYDFPACQKAFYMKKCKNENFVRGFDFLFPGIGEIIGGSERETDYLKIKQCAKELGVDIPWYVDLRKWGYGTSCGFGLGIERLVMWCCGVKNIRDVIPYPRSYPQLKF